MKDRTLIGAVVVTHGRFGEELVAAARMIVGQAEHVRSVSIDWNADTAEAKRQIQEAIEGTDRGAGVIILTDMFGGTPSNVALSFLKKGRVEIVSGVNLPMVVKLASQADGEDLTKLVAKVRDQGITQITVAGELLGE
jgi:PTS system mannose-specific IIA component